MNIEVLRPSALGAAELAAWRALAAASPTMRRAFCAPGFALACEAAHGRARVAVLHEAGTIAGFLAFQFAGPWQQRAGLAERIGGELCDAAGLLAAPGTVVDPPALLRQCRLGALAMTHLTGEQASHGLTPQTQDIGHVIDLRGGLAAYLAGLRPEFLRDTARRLRRAEREYGALRFSFDAQPAAADALALIGRKRAQYRRTGAKDPFDAPRNVRLIEALCAAPAPDCRPVLTRLHAGGRVLAEHFGLLCGDVLSHWFPVYDPAAEKVSPGRLLLWHQIGQAEACGVAFVDRGEGDSAAKRDFSTGTQSYGSAYWSARTPRGLAARALQSALWRLG